MCKVKNSSTGTPLLSFASCISIVNRCIFWIFHLLPSFTCRSSCPGCLMQIQDIARPSIERSIQSSLPHDWEAFLVPEKLWIILSNPVTLPIPDQRHNYVRFNHSPDRETIEEYRYHPTNLFNCGIYLPTSLKLLEIWLYQQYWSYLNPNY